MRRSLRSALATTLVLTASLLVAGTTGAASAATPPAGPSTHAVALGPWSIVPSPNVSA